MVELDSDGWPVGEKRHNCDRCPNSKDGKPDGVNCDDVKQCMDHLLKELQAAINDNNPMLKGESNE